MHFRLACKPVLTMDATNGDEGKMTNGDEGKTINGEDKALNHLPNGKPRTSKRSSAEHSRGNATKKRRSHHVKDEVIESEGKDGSSKDGKVETTTEVIECKFMCGFNSHDHDPAEIIKADTEDSTSTTRSAVFNTKRRSQHMNQYAPGTETR